MVHTPSASGPPLPVVAVHRAGAFLCLSHSFYSMMFNFNVKRTLYVRVQSTHADHDLVLPRWVWCSS